MSILKTDNPSHRMRFRRIISNSILLVGISISLFCIKVCMAQDRQDIPFKKGETITYDIKKFKLNVGKATLVFGGTVNMNNQKAVLITVTAEGFQFYDREEIYLDPETYQPILIKRDLDIFGKKEIIVERYNKNKGKVRIVKTAKGKVSEQVIENGGRFDNIYGFIYFYRCRGKFQKGEEFKIHLPTRDATFTLVKEGKFKAAGQEFDAYYLDSVPKKYKVRFDSNEQKIPLMINGAIGFGPTSMIMNNYENHSRKEPNPTPEV